jgi:hypothetical protein
MAQYDAQLISWNVGFGTAQPARAWRRAVFGRAYIDPRLFLLGTWCLPKRPKGPVPTAPQLDSLLHPGILVFE